MTEGAISEREQRAILYYKGPQYDEVVERLRKAEYVSPQGVPFHCQSCRYVRGATSLTGVIICAHPDIKAPVEAKGCCDYWTSPEGVHG